MAAAATSNVVPGRTWPLLFAPLLVVAAQFTAVRPTNFAGADEWLVLSLASRGIVGFPYADRPLALLWCLPGELLVRHDLAGHLVAQVLYLAIGGALVAWLANRRLGLSPAVALLAGVFAAAWAPLDRMRLDPVVTTRYSGCTAASVAAMLLFVEGWRRGRPLAAAAGAIVAVAMVLSLEATLPLLAGAPLLALAAQPGALGDREARRRLILWSAAWEIVLVGAAVPLLLSLAGLRGGYRYQAASGVDPHPLRLAATLVQQFAFSLAPLVSTPPAELARRAVPLALAAFGLASFALRRVTPVGPEGETGRRALARTAALGAALAVLGWMGLVLSPLVRTSARTQFLSAPGMGLLLACSLALAASWTPARARALVLALAGAWVVAVGTGRIGAMQDEWDRASVWPGERGSLAQLVGHAPSLAPNTLVVLIDESRSWPVTLIFRHAIHYLYGEGVVGLVWQGREFLYPSRFAADGIRSEPWPVIQRAWRSPPTLHRYDEVLVARFSAGGRLRVLDEWPPELTPLPPGASYAPRARIGSGPPPPSSRILARER